LRSKESSDLWIKTLHIPAVISWMAGMLYLPRLLVYHAGAQPKSKTSELFKVMERRLFKEIMNPAMARPLRPGCGSPGETDVSSRPGGRFDRPPQG
jgi:uncharacterized integral membrane protein (TIGR00701 family)